MLPSLLRAAQRSLPPSTASRASQQHQAAAAGAVVAARCVHACVWVHVGGWVRGWLSHAE